MRRLLILVMLAGFVVACGGGDEEPSADTVSTEIAAGIAASMESQSAATVTPSDRADPTTTQVPDATATNTAVPPTSTPEPTDTPRPTNTLTPTKAPTPTNTPAPTVTPDPVDLTQYLPIEADLHGPSVIVQEEPLEATSFVHEEGFVQGRMRGLARKDRPILVVANCAEYGTTHHAMEALEQQYVGTMNYPEAFTLAEDDHSAIDTANAYLVGGTTKTDDGERPVSIAWFQAGRVMCFTSVLGIPGSENPPRGSAIDAANQVLERLRVAALPTPTPIPDDPDVFDIGDKITYEDGFSISVKAVEDPVVGSNGDAVSPRASIVLVAIEVEACAGPETDDASISPLDFEISLDDNTRADSSFGFDKEPELDSASLFPGECLTGWVTFERHWKPRPVYVVIDPIGYSTVRVKAK